jgi:Zn-dependent protease/CBS domain-containing protein
MKWSLKIARVAGIDIYLHTTFLILVGFVALSYWFNQGNLPAMVEGVLFLLAIFLCVLLHELGHALAARKYGIETQDIMLMPLGGLARLERMPEKPRQELWVALAGPLVNVVIALVLFAGLILTNSFEPLTSMSITQGNFFERLLAVNIMLVVFNLLPAFPMDGGRVVRALLAMRMDYARATQIAATLGQGMAFVLGFIGLFSNPFLVFIALFVWIGASQESSMVQVKSALSGIPVSRAMLTNFESLAPTDPLARPVQLILSGSQQDFPVVTGRSVVGILTRADIIRALAEHNENTFVSYIMRKDFQVIEPNQMLESISQTLQAKQQSILPVVQNGELVGLVTMENIGEFMMIQSAIRSRKMAQA